jgi:hypothetical protein
MLVVIWIVTGLVAGSIARGERFEKFEGLDRFGRFKPLEPLEPLEPLDPLLSLISCGLFLQPGREVRLRLNCVKPAHPIMPEPA